MKIIEDHITFINTAKSTQEIFERFTKVMNHYGYDQVFYGHAPDNPARAEEKKVTSVIFRRSGFLITRKTIWRGWIRLIFTD